MPVTTESSGFSDFLSGHDHSLLFKTSVKHIQRCPQSEGADGLIFKIRQKVNMMPFGKRGQIRTPVPFGILKMPGLDTLAVKVVDNYSEIVFRASKHVAGAVENDLFLIFEKDLVQLAARRSGVGAHRESWISRPVLRIFKAEHPAEHIQPDSSVTGQRSLRMQHGYLHTYLPVD